MIGIVDIGYPSNPFGITMSLLLSGTMILMRIKKRTNPIINREHLQLIRHFSLIFCMKGQFYHSFLMVTIKKKQQDLLTN